MNHMSLKIRISLWFTILLMVISIVVFFIAAEVYWNYEEQMIQNELLDAVKKESFLLQTDLDYIEKFNKGEIPDSEFLKEDIHLMILDEEGNRVSGVSINDLPYIWELFYRGDKSRNSRGMGLGLSLVKQIVKYHNGSITVESAVEKGTAFFIMIPKKEE